MTPKPEPLEPDPLTPGRLTATEAAARLGVKRQTLYAYVSRGLLAREVAADGRSSLFDAAEVDRLAQGRKRTDEGEITTVVNSAITRVADGGLWIRGQDLAELVDQDLAYEDIVDVLWESGPAEPWLVSPTNATSLAVIRDHLPESTQNLDRLRIAAALASSLDPLRHDLSPRSVRAAGRELIGLMALSLPTSGSLPRSGSLPTAGTSKGTRLADRLWLSLAGSAGKRVERDALNAALSLLVDHGLAASNFAARLAGSVRADPYSVVIAGLGVVGGTLHGAASAAVHELLIDAEQLGDAAAAVGNTRRRLGVLPGFGHRVYTLQDPRYAPLMARVVDAYGSNKRLAVVQRVRDVIGERTDAIPNIDLALGSLTYLAKMDPHAGEVVFAIARSAGWLAHATEEYAEEPLRFRPRARYVGPVK